MKIILIVLDGVGDRSYPSLGHRTPLQAAKTPNLDRLAQLGSNGLFHASCPGQCLPSETAHFLLLGYGLKDFPGRGLLEAVGAGVPFENEDVLSLAHLSSILWKEGAPVLEQGRKEIDGTESELASLFAALTPYKTRGIRLQLCRTGHNDGILILKGPVSPHVSDSDPMVQGRSMARIHPLAGNPEPKKAEATARALNSYLIWCHRALSSHEVNRLRREANRPLINFLATQRCGRRSVVEPFRERWGMSGMLIASGAVYAGLARELGLTSVVAKDSREPGADLRDRVRMALGDPLHDFILIHTKAPDEAAHRGDPELKRRAIATLDTGLTELPGEVETRKDLIVVVTADHSTPCVSSLIHSGESVPVTLTGPGMRRDDVGAFDEISAAKGCVGLLRGCELMLTLLNCADLSALAGHRLGAVERAYFPRDYPLFGLTDE
jgi:2,3-bisphosphoglycerate-independent phosphoglycerate mutase